MPDWDFSSPFSFIIQKKGLMIPRLLYLKGKLPIPRTLALSTRAQRLVRPPIMKVAWDRLIRFVSTDGRTLYGEPILPSEDFDLGNTTEHTKLQAKVIQGDDLYDVTGKTAVTDEIVTVQELLGPLAQSDVDILRCVGLNYAKHSMFAPPFTSST